MDSICTRCEYQYMCKYAEVVNHAIDNINDTQETLNKASIEIKLHASIICDRFSPL